MPEIRAQEQITDLDQYQNPEKKDLPKWISNVVNTLMDPNQVEALSLIKWLVQEEAQKLRWKSKYDLTAEDKDLLVLSARFRNKDNVLKDLKRYKQSHGDMYDAIATNELYELEVDSQPKIDLDSELKKALMKGDNTPSK